MADMLALSILIFIYLSIIVNGARDVNSSSERKRKMADILILFIYLFLSYLSILVNGASNGNSSSERKRKMADMFALSIYLCISIYLF